MCNLQQLSFFEQCVVMRTSCKVCWSTPEACQITCCLQIAIITLMRQVIFTRQVPSIHFLFLMIPRHNHHFLRLFGTCGMFMQLETLETNSHNLAKFLSFFKMLNYIPIKKSCSAKTFSVMPPSCFFQRHPVKPKEVLLGYLLIELTPIQLVLQFTLKNALFSSDIHGPF